MDVEAPDYLPFLVFPPGRGNFSSDSGRGENDSNHVQFLLKDKSAGRPTDELLIRLFRNPAPSLRIVVPEGFRGLIKLHFADYPGPSPTQPQDKVFTITTNDRGEASIITSHLDWHGFDRREQIVVTDGRAEYPLTTQSTRSDGIAARPIELLRPTGTLIHLGDRQAYARDGGALPAMAYINGQLIWTNIPTRESFRAVMQGARQEQPQ